MDDAFRKLLAEQDMMRRHTDMLRGIHDQISPSVNALKFLSENSEMTRMIEDAKRQQDMMRSVLGPIEDLRRMGLLDSPGLMAARDAYLEFQNRFRLPEINEATRLFKQFEESGAASAMRHLHDQTAGIRQALQGARPGWTRRTPFVQSAASQSCSGSVCP